MKKILLTFGAVVGAIALVCVGVLIGNRYNFTDALCPSGYGLYALEENLVTDNGIIIPKEATIPMKSCAYMIRFPVYFRAELTAPVKRVGEAEGPMHIELQKAKSHNEIEGT